jgi:hypothetical protein
MKLLTNELRERLLDGRNRDQDHAPVVKFFTPDAQCTWLISEMDEDGDTLFGLCDLGMGCPELGYVLLSEIEAVRGKFRLPAERDRHWSATKPMSAYAEAASKAGMIVDRL